MLLSATGCYITGFLTAALVFWLVTAKLRPSPAVAAAACILGLLVCYAFGAA